MDTFSLIALLLIPFLFGMGAGAGAIVRILRWQRAWLAKKGKRYDGLLPPDVK